MNNSIDEQKTERVTEKQISTLNAIVRENANLFSYINKHGKRCFEGITNINSVLYMTAVCNALAKKGLINPISDIDERKLWIISQEGMRYLTDEMKDKLHKNMYELAK